MSFFLNKLSRFVTPFFPRSLCLLISWLHSPSAVILECKKVKSVPTPTFSPSIYHDVMGPDAIILVFGEKPTFSLSSLTLIKRLFTSSTFSAIRVVSSAYLRLLIFLPATLIPTWASSSLAFHIIYSAYKLNNRVTMHSLDSSLYFIQPGISHDVLCM